MTSRYRVADDVAWTSQSDGVVAARLPHGAPVVLAGTSALVWKAVTAIAPSTADTVVRAVALTAGQADPTVRDGVVGFLDQLVAAGLLAQVGEEPSSESR